LAASSANEGRAVAAEAGLALAAQMLQELASKRSARLHGTVTRMSIAWGLSRIAFDEATEAKSAALRH
jgi:hypothetical protein